MNRSKLNQSQFSLRAILLTMTVLCALLALVVSSNHFVRLVAGCVIGANVLGFTGGLIVTHVFKMPRDGGYRNQDPSED